MLKVILAKRFKWRKAIFQRSHVFCFKAHEQIAIFSTEKVIYHKNDKTLASFTVLQQYTVEELLIQRLKNDGTPTTMGGFAIVWLNSTSSAWTRERIG